MQDDGAKSYRGKGWDFVRLNELPEWIAAPIAVLGSLALLCLLGVGVSIIFSLVDRVWSGGADTVQAASAALTAIAAIFGAVFLTWRTVVAHWQARASQEQATIQRETLYTTLFTKAVEQLGTTREVSVKVASHQDQASHSTITTTEPNIEVRLGAIYALEQIAHDSLRDHWPIMEVLSAYVRENSPRSSNHLELPTNAIRHSFDSEEAIRTVDALIEKEKNELRSPRVDIQAAITVIGRRPESRRDWEKKHERNIDLRNSDLRGIDFSRLWFDNATFEGANLEFAEFISSHFSGAQFNGCNLTGSNIWESDLSSTHFNNALGKAMKCVRCDLTDSHITFSDFTLSTWNYSKMHGIYCWQANFGHASLYHIDSARSIFADCKFNNASLSQAEFYGVDFKQSHFDHAELDNVAAFETDFSKATGLNQSQIDAIFEGDLSTKFAPTLLRPTRWPSDQLTEANFRERTRHHNGDLIRKLNAERASKKD
jgi:uncharacterized protein YjbI with pentapeptide repeats